MVPGDSVGSNGSNTSKSSSVLLQSLWPLLPLVLDSKRSLFPWLCVERAVKLVEYL